MKQMLSIRKLNQKLFLIGLFKIPMIGFVRPKIILMNEIDAVVKIRMKRRTKNHLNSMYLGALAVGADIAAGMHAFFINEIEGTNMRFAFKGMKAEFIKRAESDVYFKSQDGNLIRQSFNLAVESGDSINQEIKVTATDSHNELIAEFIMTVSIKVK